MSARFYAPSLGAFTQLDTVMGGAQNPLSMNRFLYAEANPATLIDPTGHCVRWQDGYCVGALSTPARKQLAHKPTLNRNRNTIPNDEWVPSRNRQRKTTPKFTLAQVKAMDPLEIAIYGRGALRDLIGGNLDPAMNPGGFHVANAYLTDRNRELVASIGGALNPNDFISGSRLELRRDLAYAAGDNDAYGLLSATLASETGLGELEMVMGGTVGGSAAIGRNSSFLTRAERAMRGGGVGNVGLDERVSRLVGESSGGGSTGRINGGDSGVHQLPLFPDEAYDRVKHYGTTPTREQRRAVPDGMEFDHDPALVVHYYEGAPGSIPGFRMTPGERRAYAASLSSGGAATPAVQRAQGGLARYSKNMKAMFGLE